MRVDKKYKWESLQSSPSLQFGMVVVWLQKQLLVRKGIEIIDFC